MKKFLLSLLILCCMTAAWAGSGDGSKEHPFSGEWTVNELQEKNLKEGMYLAHDCVITDGMITVDDSKLGERIATNWNRWDVGAPIRDYDDGSYANYEVYRGYNAPEDREKHMFIVTGVKVDVFTLDLQGYYSGHYDRGDGTKENPYWGEWTIYELYDKLEDGVHLALDCDIKCDGDYISVKDTRLNQEVASMWSAWSPGNFIGDTNPGGPYTQYGKDNPLDNRKEQTFVVTDKDTSFGNTATFHIIGHFSGFYTTTDADDFVYVESAEQMKIILRGNDNVEANTHAKIKLTDDIYLTDIAVGTFCDTFYGTLDGDGHTIYGSHEGTRENKTYLFANSDGATFKNLNFYNIRIDSRENSNQAVITSQAKNGCVFENITFDKISTYTSYDNTAAAVGYAENCTFTNITVKNSDFTVNINQSGTVVAHAMNCAFENIKVENCESTARKTKAGGVVGFAKGCTFNGVEVLGSFIKTYEEYVGGIIGNSERSTIGNCTIDDKSCVFATYDNNVVCHAGGIVGCSNGDWIYRCVNSALIACNGDYAGGIAGSAVSNAQIESCLNSGMIIKIEEDQLNGNNGYYSKYKNKELHCVTKYYSGKEYVVRKTDLGDKLTFCYGGIVGSAESSSITKCANIGSMNKTYSTGGIVGETKSNVTISNCLSDVLSPGDICGILADGRGSTKIINCVNASGKTSYYGSGVVEVTNLFSFDRNNMTKNELAWGKICYQLGEDWEQNIGTDPYPTPTGNRGEYHTRKVSNQYGTVCLPFSVKSDEEISYYTFSEATEGSDITLKFSYAEKTIPAGTPLLYRVAGFDAIGAEDLPVEICFNYWGPGFTETPIAPESSTWGMEGTFEEKVIEGEDAKSIYYVSGGAIKNAMKTTIAPFRAFFHGPSIEELTGNSTSQARAIRFVLEDGDGESLALELVGDDLVPVQPGAKSYSLMGTEVGDGYRGLVIKNGKKVIQNR